MVLPCQFYCPTIYQDSQPILSMILLLQHLRTDFGSEKHKEQMPHKCTHLKHGKQWELYL